MCVTVESFSLTGPLSLNAVNRVGYSLVGLLSLKNFSSYHLERILLLHTADLRIKRNDSSLPLTLKMHSFKKTETRLIMRSLRNSISLSC